MAFAICSSTDLLSHPRAISSFYGRLQMFRTAMARIQANLWQSSTGVVPHARLASPFVRH